MPKVNFNSFKEVINYGNELHFCLELSQDSGPRVIDPLTLPKKELDRSILCRETIKNTFPSKDDPGIIIRRDRFLGMKWYIQQSDSLFARIVRYFFTFAPLEILSVKYVNQGKTEKRETFYVAADTSEDYWSRFKASDWNTCSEMMVCESKPSSGLRNVCFHKNPENFEGADLLKPSGQTELVKLLGNREKIRRVSTKFLEKALKSLDNSVILFQACIILARSAPEKFMQVAWLLKKKLSKDQLIQLATVVPWSEERNMREEFCLICQLNHEEVRAAHLQSFKNSKNYSQRVLIDGICHGFALALAAQDTPIPNAETEKRGRFIQAVCRAKRKKEKHTLYKSELVPAEQLSQVLQKCDRLDYVLVIRCDEGDHSIYLSKQRNIFCDINDRDLITGVPQMRSLESLEQQILLNYSGFHTFTLRPVSKTWNDPHNLL